jgi:hypothetical protein
MVDELYILIWNRTKKPLATALSGAGKMLRGRDRWSNQCRTYVYLELSLWIPPAQWIYPNLKKDSTWKKFK